jgi:hypothetical protein
LFNENLRDLGIFNDEILPLLKTKGYEIFMMPKAVYGKGHAKTTKVPDLDIRLKDLTEKDILRLNEQYRKLVSKPQSSGYQDIQVRLTHKKLKDVPIELIILFSKDYAKAKHNESKYVYNILREFRRLHVAADSTMPMEHPGRRILQNIDIISNKLIDNISKPLFSNAENAKVPGFTPARVGIDEQSGIFINGLLDNLKIRTIPEYYKSELKKAKTLEEITFLKDRQKEALLAITAAKKAFAGTVRDLTIG